MAHGVPAPVKDYFEWQKSYYPDMRVTLVCWIQEVCAKLRFQRTTFHTALCFLDHYFEKATYVIPVTEFQTIGVTTIVIAAKMGEVYVPDSDYFAAATGKNNVSTEAIFAMQAKMMATL